MSEILNELFKGNLRAEPTDNIHFVFIDKNINEVVEKVSASEAFFSSIEKVQKGEFFVVKLDNPADAEVGFKWIEE